MNPGGDFASLGLQDDLDISPSTAGLDRDPCFLCDDDPTWFCTECKDVFCSGCWDQVPAHRKVLEGRRGSRSRPRLPHERVDLKAYYRLSEIFDREYTAKERDALFEWEAGAKWIYVTARNSGNGDFRLGNSYRFTDLTAHGWEEGLQEQFPSLVSFVGQTGNNMPQPVSFCHMEYLLTRTH